MAETPLEKSSYSLHFIMLTYLGAWAVDPNNPRVLNAYVVYKVLMSIVAFGGAFLVFLDFLEIFGDLKKMSWNIYVSMLLSGGLIKNLYSTHRSNLINSMRRKLHRSATARETPEDIVINNRGEKELKYVRWLFYGGVGATSIVWLGSWYFSYLWGPRGIPIPIYIPFHWDPEDELQYNLVFFVLSLFGCVTILFVIESEMAMFTLLIQISREYRRLLKDIRKTNQLYSGGFWASEEASRLRKWKTRNLLQQYCNDHQQLIQFTKDFQLCYGYILLGQMVLLSLMITLLAVLCFLEYGNLSMNLCYQVGYISVVTVDMFLVCWFSSRIHGQCLEVGDEAYSVFWYLMDTDIQKDISLIIMRSQHPPKITSGEIVEVNLHAFLQMMSNVYSCIALLRQLMFKLY